MADKYLYNDGKGPAEKAAITTSAGTDDAGKIVALDSSGRLDTTMLPPGIGTETDQIACSENLAAGDLVNIYADSGAKVRKADGSTTGKPAHGFVLSSATSGDTVTVYRPSQSITGLTGLTPGSTYFMSGSTAGAVVATAPTGAGKTLQVIGTAISATAISFNPQTPITLA